jgi:hypothetical protein
VEGRSVLRPPDWSKIKKLLGSVLLAPEAPPESHDPPADPHEENMRLGREACRLLQDLGYKLEWDNTMAFIGLLVFAAKGDSRLKGQVFTRPLGEALFTADFPGSEVKIRLNPLLTTPEDSILYAFTALHEGAHVHLEHKKATSERVKNRQEQQADNLASYWLNNLLVYGLLRSHHLKRKSER